MSKLCQGRRLRHRHNPRLLKPSKVGDLHGGLTVKAQGGPAGLDMH